GHLVPAPRFSAWATMPANTPARLHGLALDGVLDRVDDALGLVPFLVDAHAAGGAPCDVLADEDHGGLGPPRPGDVGDSEAFGHGACIDHADARGSASRDLGRPLWRHARSDADALPVEQEANELQVPLVGRRE